MQTTWQPPSFKVTFVGPTSVGKTSILNFIDFHEFDENNIAPTTSMQCHPHTYTNQNGKSIQINFWDTAGQEQYKSLGPMYYRNASSCIAVFDINNNESFKQMQEYIRMFKENNDIGVANKIIIAANKIDLLDDHTKSIEFLEWSEKEGYTLVMTSAKTGEGINDLVHEVGELLMPKSEVLEPQRSNEVLIEIREVSTENKKKCC